MTQQVFIKAWPEIREFLDFDELAPYLAAEDLANQNDYHNLTTGDKSSRQKCLFRILPTKGPDAYQLFYQCVCKETQHRGHEFVRKKLEEVAGALAGKCVKHSLGTDPAWWGMGIFC